MTYMPFKGRLLHQVVCSSVVQTVLNFLQGLKSLQGLNSFVPGLLTITLV